MLGRIRTFLPIHPTMRHPKTGEPLQAIGWINGRPIFPVMGGAPDDDDDKDDDKDKDKDKDADDDRGKGKDDDKSKDDDDDEGDPERLGFPRNTPLAEMTEKQQLAYWRHQSKKHEKTSKARGDYDEMKRKADEFDKLEKASRSKHEQELEDAKETVRKEEREKTLPALVRAEMKAAAAGRVDNDQLDVILDPLDMTKFLTDKGEVDTDKVTKFIDGIAPGDGKGGRTKTDLGQGRRGGGGKASGVDAGREMFASSRKSKAAADT